MLVKKYNLFVLIIILFLLLQFICLYNLIHWRLIYGMSKCQMLLSVTLWNVCFQVVRKTDRAFETQ